MPAVNVPGLALEQISGLTEPTSLVILADNDLLVTEKSTGRVVHVQNGVVGEAVLDLATNSFDERGTLGIALHPNFAKNCYVYIYWTWTGVGTEPDGLLGADSAEPAAVPLLGNRVDRFVWDGERLTFDQNIVQLRSNTIVDQTGRVRGNHDGGVITFGPDGKLYVIIGDQNLRGQLQNIEEGHDPTETYLAGVILRLNDDGSTPDDNPFVDEGDTVAKIFVYGVRNSFGIAFDPISGSLWQTENGDDAYDEVNVFGAGDNSGWIQLLGLPERFEDYKEIEVGTVDGLDNPEYPPTFLAESADEALERLFELPGSEYRSPVFVWRFPVALTALTFVPDEGLGADFEGDLLVGAGLSGSLLRFDLNKDRSDLVLTGGLEDRVDDNAAKGDLAETADNVIATGLGIITDLEPDPNGSLWVVSLSNGSLYHITAVAQPDGP
jgi:glucose/arabinose dehydrogenase